MIIEMLFPEIANLHGDNANITYLAQCRPDARVVKTRLTDEPLFATSAVDLIYLGPLTEKGQLKAIERLRPHRDRIEQLIEAGTHFLFTHNALEVLGSRIHNAEMGYDAQGVGIFDIESEVRMFGRYNGKVMGVVDEAGPEHPVIGFKSQFSFVTGAADQAGFLTATRGIGRNENTPTEGIRRKNFIGTSLIGPLLVVNPYFTRGLLASIDPMSTPQLAHERLAIEAYETKLRDFEDDRRWHAFERVALQSRG